MEIQNRQDAVLLDNKTMHEDFPVHPAGRTPASSHSKFEPHTPDTPRRTANQTAAEKTGAETSDGLPLANERAAQAHEKADRYLAELIEEVGGLTPEDTAEARAWWNPTRSSPQTEEPAWAD